MRIDRPSDPLNTRLDLKDGQAVSIKIPRPRAKVQPEKGSEDLAKYAHPDFKDAAQDSPKDFNISASSMQSEEEFVKAVSSVDWGDYNPENIVDLLYKLSTLVTGREWKAYQSSFIRRVFRSIIINDGEVISYLVSRQAGKSESVAGAATTLCVAMPTLAKVFPDQLGIYKDGFKVGIFAPSGEQATFIYNRMMKFARSQSASEVYEDADFGIKMERFGCKWTNGSFAFAQSANPRSNIEGRDLSLAIIEESQDMDSTVCSTSIEPMLAWSNGTAVYIGTVSDEPCYFYDTIQQGKSTNLTRPHGMWNHFEYDYQEVIKHNPRYAKFVQQQIARHGINSPAFQKSFALRWQFEDTMPIPPAILKQHCMYVPTPLIPYSNEPCVAGIDLAEKRYGSVITVARIVRLDQQYEEDGEIVTKHAIPTLQVCDWFTIEDVPFPDQRPAMKDFLSRFTNLKAIVVDTTGLGTVMFQEMQREWGWNNLEPFVFSPKSKNYLMNLFMEYMYSRRLIIPNTDDVRILSKWQNFYLQMVNMKKITKQGYTYLNKVDKESARDDFPDSLFLCLHAMQKSLGISADIEVFDNGVGIRSISSSSVDTSNMGIEALRASVREGSYGMRNTRDERAAKLLRGMFNR
jgi:hypothetical protein